MAVSALVGVALARSLGWFGAISEVPTEELVTLVVAAMGSLTGEAEAPGPGR